MSLKKIGEVKSDKGFKIFDLLVYGIIIAIVAVTFIAVFTTKDTSALSGIRIFSDNNAVFEYDFGNGEYRILNKSAVLILSESDNALELKILYKDEFNTVSVDKSGSVKVTDSDCANKTCIAMKEIKDNSGIIYCSPHRLKIEPYEFVPNKDVIV